ncbi:MAG: hypothetical protein L0958_03700 [Candidatus Mariimomonas ferrooxydans]
MKKRILLFFLTVSLSACAGMKSTGKNMAVVEGVSSPARVELLRQRVSNFWTAFIAEDYEKVYYIYDPFFQAVTNKYAFMGSVGRIKYHELEIKDIKGEGNVAKVKVRLVYSMPTTKFKRSEFTVPETQTEIEETWLYIYDNWYKEYYMKMMDKAVVEY